MARPQGGLCVLSFFDPALYCFPSLPYPLTAICDPVSALRYPVSAVRYRERGLSGLDRDFVRFNVGRFHCPVV